MCACVCVWWVGEGPFQITGGAGQCRTANGRQQGSAVQLSVSTDCVCVCVEGGGGRTLSNHWRGRAVPYG